jgi:5-methylcytosine-specific restriction endonuclease McrA
MEAEMDKIGEFGLECTCENKEPRKRQIKGGAITYGTHCLNCGKFENKGVKIFGFSPPTQFADEDIKKKFRIRCQEHWQQRRQEQISQKDADNRQWWEKYNAYLQSPVWMSRRDAVLKRDKYLCQGCLSRRAEHVHHLTYDHCGNELAFELISVCVECHKKLHPHMKTEELPIDWNRFS